MTRVKFVAKMELQSTPRSEPLLGPSSPQDLSLSTESSNDGFLRSSGERRFYSKESSKFIKVHEQTDGVVFSKEQRMWGKLNLIVVVWLLIGAGFYQYFEGWNYDQALFYAVNVGLGIGYGEMTVRGPAAMLFTVVYCIMGSTFIASTAGPVSYTHLTLPTILRV